MHKKIEGARQREHDEQSSKRNAHPVRRRPRQPARPSKPETLARLPKDKEIIVHCDTGQQQNKAVTALRLLGYDAYVMKYGYMAWSPAPPTAGVLEAIKESVDPGYPVQK